MSILWILLACHQQETTQQGQINLPHTAPLRRLTDQQYANAIFDLLDVHLPDDKHPKTIKDKSFRTWSANNRITASGAESLLLSSEYAIQHADLDTLANCNVDELECSKTFLLDFASQAYHLKLCLL